MGLPVAVALLILGLIAGQVWARRSRRLWGVGTARPGLALAALAALVGALVTGVKGLWPEAVVLLVLAAGLAAVARGRALGRERQTAPPLRSLGREEAAALLGVAPDAAPEQVQAAYRRLIRSVHPDQGGTAALAAQLNAARAVMLLRP